MVLHPIDWIIAFLCLSISFLPALAFGKRSGKSTSEFFASGRSVPWWLTGISLVATTFSSDTPNLVANIRANAGGGWQLAVVGIHADRRRHSVLLCAALATLRCSDRPGILRTALFGKSASAVRGFRAIYLACFSTA